MAVKDNTLIRFPRCREIWDNRQQAVEHLSDFIHVTGQPVIVSYYKSEEHTLENIDTVVAIGVANGTGKNCYRIITTGQFMVIWGVVEEIPDISLLRNGEVYLYHQRASSSGLLVDRWYFVSGNPNGTKSVEEVSDTPMFFIVLADNSLWASSTDRKVRPLSDFYTKEEIQGIVDQIYIETDFDKIKEKLDLAVEKSDYAAAKVDELDVEVENLNTKVDENEEATSQAIEEIYETIGQIQSQTINYYELRVDTGSSVTIQKTTHKCGPNPSVTVYFENVEVFADVEVDDEGTVTINWTATPTEESPIRIVLIGKEVVLP